MIAADSWSVEQMFHRAALIFMLLLLAGFAIDCRACRLMTEGVAATIDLTKADAVSKSLIS